MRIYIGTAALQIGLGLAIGLLLGWALTRAYFVALLRRIQRRVADLTETALTEKVWEGVEELRRRGRAVRIVENFDRRDSGYLAAPVTSTETQTELRRRKL